MNAKAEATTEPGDGFAVRFLAPDGSEQRRALAQVANVAFEDVAPVRSFPAFRGQRNNTGRWWVATTSRHVGYESWLERDHVIRLDFEPDVVGLASQPFWLTWHDGSRLRRHAPDYFARLADGTALVIDCRPKDRVPPQDAAVFAATKRACAAAGWRYQLVHELPIAWMANLRWLAGYRHTRCRGNFAEHALTLAAQPHQLHELAQRLGDPIATLPVLFHLLWHGTLTTNLSRPLHERSIITATGAPA